MNFWQGDHLTDDGRGALKTALTVTASSKADPEHMLLAMFQDASSVLVKTALRQSSGLDLTGLCETLIIAVQPSVPRPTPAEWSDAMLSERFLQMLEAVRGEPAYEAADAGFREQLLAAGVLKSARDRVLKVLTNSGLDVDELVGKLETPRSRREGARQLFLEDGALRITECDKSARGVLRLAETEGKGLGQKRIGTPLLLFALLAHKNSLLENALRLQAPKVDVRRVLENLAMHLKALGKGRFNAELALNRGLMQDRVVQTLERAGHEADEVERELITEADLLKSLLLSDNYFVESYLRGEHVDLAELSKVVNQRVLNDELDEPEENALPSIAEVADRLRNRVVGQDHVIDAVMPIIKRLRFSYQRKGRPAGVLLFLGMSGTGKTQLAKEIAHAVYGSSDALIFLEMGQFGTEYSKTIFIGAPPGLVGYGEGLLTNGLRDKPESVVLFDEVEKAHKSVFDVLLRFLDEGQIADPAGPVRDGTKCIIILTSNHALDVLKPLIEQQTAAGKQTTQELAAARAETRRAILQTEFFRPEFINRVDDILLFNTFTAEAYERIVANLLNDEITRFRDDKDLEVTIDPAVRDYIVNLCLERRDEGARVCGKLVAELVVTSLIDFFVSDGNQKLTGATLQMTRAGDIEIVGRDQ